MENLIVEISSRIEHIEKRPLMYCQSNTYESISSLIFGYFLGIESFVSVDLNLQFSDWLNQKADKTSLIWNAYIWNISADKDSELALKILFVELKEFIKTLKG